MKLTLLLCLVLLSTIVLSVPVNINKNVDEVESMPESDDSKDELSRKFKGPIKIKKCAKPDQSFEYYQRWCPTTAMTTTTSTTTTPTTTTSTTTAATTTTAAAAARF